MLYLACYDIERDSLRNRMATRLLDLGLERIQYSVFVGTLTDVRRTALEAWVKQKLEKEKKTNFMLLPLHQYSVDEGVHLGTDPPDWEYLSGRTLTLIL
jgi:CRISPR-associated protein Cas2